MSKSAERLFRPRAILLGLADHAVEFTIIGGVAVQTHGHQRGTKDVDVIPGPGLLNLSRLAEALAALSARLRGADRPIDVGDPHVLRRAALVSARDRIRQVGPAQHRPHGGTSQALQELRERAVEVELDGRIVAVAGLDDLIRMKRVAGREVDLSDIAALTRTDEQLRDEAGEST